MTRVSWMSTKIPSVHKIPPVHKIPRILRRNESFAETVRHAENGLIRHIRVVPQGITVCG